MQSRHRTRLLNFPEDSNPIPWKEVEYERCPCARLIATVQTDHSHASIVENDADERAVNVHATAVIVNET
jgi:hypothetical protein